MTPPFTLRPATPDDAPWAVPLIQATIGPIGRALTSTQTDQQAEEALRPFFMARGNRLSFERTLVAEDGAAPLGLAVSYAGDLAPALDDPFRARLTDLALPTRIETEAEPDEWYLDTLTVQPEARGRGVGGALVEAVAERARMGGWQRLGLLAEPGNEPAQRLYARLGFRAVGRRSVAGTAFLHLTRALK